VVACLARRRGEDVALNAGAMVEDLADGHAPRHVLIGIVRPRARERGVDAELAGRGELLDGDAGKELVDRAEVERGLEIVGPARLTVREPVGPLELGST